MNLNNPLSCPLGTRSASDVPLFQDSTTTLLIQAFWWLPPTVLVSGEAATHLLALQNRTWPLLFVYWDVFGKEASRRAPFTSCS